MTNKLESGILEDPQQVRKPGNKSKTYFLEILDFYVKKALSMTSIKSIFRRVDAYPESHGRDPESEKE